MTHRAKMSHAFGSGPRVGHDRDHNRVGGVSGAGGDSWDPAAASGEAGGSSPTSVETSSIGACSDCSCRRRASRTSAITGSLRREARLFELILGELDALEAVPWDKSRLREPSLAVRLNDFPEIIASAIMALETGALIPPEPKADEPDDTVRTRVPGPMVF